MKCAVCKGLGILLFFFAMHVAHAATNIEVDMHKVTKNGTAETIGTVKVDLHDNGIEFTPDLKGLTPGLHGFHVHENGSCEPKKKDAKVVPAGAAGGHLNLLKEKRHEAPWGNGHTGDLPALFVDEKGNAQHPVFAPNLQLEAIKGKAIIIHEGGDNYSDKPKPLGGGGARVACGII